MEDRLKFWNNRANLGFKAGSNDEILKNLEIIEIKKYLKHGSKILEIGCGNGITAIEIARSYDVDLLSVDYSPKMIEHANKLLEKETNLKGRIKFQVLDIRELNLKDQTFDFIISERVLINLDSFEEQLFIINNLYDILRTEGTFLMCESSKRGLENINQERKKFNLEEVKMPWHNNYIDDEKLESEIDKIKFTLEEINHFSSTYYLLSRVINAHNLVSENKEINYNSTINKMAYKLRNLGEFSQTKIWKWVK